MPYITFHSINGYVLSVPAKYAQAIRRFAYYDMLLESEVSMVSQLDGVFFIK